jgi:hypothetical protein
MKKVIIGLGKDNTEIIDMTSEEIAQVETDKANFEAEVIQEQADKEAKENLKASAKAKLIAGEALTEDEANTIVL